jgi:RsiW-degrading membrane proteinase PrsW (M82 family)
MTAAPAPIDWTEQGSLVQPRQPAFWLFSVMLVVGGISFIEEQSFFAGTSMTAWLAGVVLLALYAIPVYLLVNALDLFEREPRSLLVGALLWGGIVATFLAGHVNTDWDSIIQKLLGAEFARDWGAAVIAPAVEELVKFLGVVVLYLIARHEFDDVLDGFVYGALVGLGFTVVEDMYYFFVHFVGEAGTSDLGGLFEGFFIRIIVGGPYSHVLLTGLTGMGLAYYVTRPDVARLKRLLVGIGLYAAGVAAHFIWNSPLLDDMLDDDPGTIDWLVWAGAKGLPFLVLLAVVVRLAIRREQHWVRGALAPEVAAGMLSDGEIDALDDLRARRASRAAVAARKGKAGEQLFARLQHAQVELAVVASGSAPDRAPRLEATRALIRSLRLQLDAVPEAGGGSPPTAGAATAAGAVPAPAPPPPFAPTHRVPPEGLASWATPNPAAGPATPLAAGLDLELVRRISDWAEVRASNGWSGWVDARRLVERASPPG